jgi:hypothetical protein
LVEIGEEQQAFPAFQGLIDPVAPAEPGIVDSHDPGGGREEFSIFPVNLSNHRVMN